MSIDTKKDNPLPWWRVPMVWLVVGGPAAVVVASSVTFGLAWHGADTVVRDKVLVSADEAAPTAPAMQARNHAATAAAR